MSIQVTPIPQLIELAAPAYLLGTANAAGSAATAIASDSTLLMFDTVAVDAITLGQSGSVGTATVPPRRDHVHAMEAVTAATQAEMEAGTSTSVFDTPGRTQYHPGVAKAWCVIATAGSLNSGSHNVWSVTDSAPGARVVVWETDFADGLYSAFANMANTSVANLFMTFNTFAVGSINHNLYTMAGPAADDASSVVVFGDQ